MSDVALATSIADREGVLLRKVEQGLPAVFSRFDGVAVQATSTTHGRLLSTLGEAGAVLETAEPDGDRIGLHRRNALRLALGAGSFTRVVYVDFDHLLRWLENDAGECAAVLGAAGAYDCGIIGRGPGSWAALPLRLAATEAVVNHIYRLMTGRSWDLLMAARSLSRAAAQAIVDDCDIESIGTDVGWPLFCEARGFTVGYVVGEGLRYRTDADYARDLPDEADRDPREWATRVRFAAQHVEAMVPFMAQISG